MTGESLFAPVYTLYHYILQTSHFSVVSLKLFTTLNDNFTEGHSFAFTASHVYCLCQPRSSYSLS